MKKYKLEYIDCFNNHEYHYHKNYMLVTKNINKAIRFNPYELYRINIYQYDYHDQKYYLYRGIKPKKGDL